MSEIASTYDALARRWDDWAARVSPDPRATWARKVFDHVAAGERAVELGCGTGVPVGALLADQYRYEGVDLSVGMLRRAQEAVANGSFTNADMLSVAYESGSLGAVVAFYSIVHVERAQHATLFGRIASWLRPGGVFVGCLPSRDDPGSHEPNWLDGGPMWWSGFDEESYRVLFDAAGLGIVESEVLSLIEPDGQEIRPMWFVAQR